MKSAQAIKRQQGSGEANAKKLTQVGMRVRLKAAFTDMETTTTSLPWQLGHGDWVVKVEGKSGGWGCDCLEVLAESGVAK